MRSGWCAVWVAAQMFDCLVAGRRRWVRCWVLMICDSNEKCVFFASFADRKGCTHVKDVAPNMGGMLRTVGATGGLNVAKERWRWTHLSLFTYHTDLEPAEEGRTERGKNEMEMGAVAKTGVGDSGTEKEDLEKKCGERVRRC